MAWSGTPEDGSHDRLLDQHRQISFEPAVHAEQSEAVAVRLAQKPLRNDVRSNVLRGLKRGLRRVGGKSPVANVDRNALRLARTAAATRSRRPAAWLDDQGTSVNSVAGSITGRSEHGPLFPPEGRLPHDRPNRHRSADELALREQAGQPRALSGRRRLKNDQAAAGLLTTAPERLRPARRESRRSRSRRIATALCSTNARLAAGFRRACRGGPRHPGGRCRGAAGCRARER